MKQRKYTADEKLSVIMEMIKGQKPVSQICKEHGIRDSLAYKWRDEGLESLKQGLSDKRAIRNRSSEAERERLLKIIDQQAVIIDFQKKCRTSWVCSPETAIFGTITPILPWAVPYKSGWRI